MTDAVPLLLPGDKTVDSNAGGRPPDSGETTRRLYDQVQPAVVEIVTARGTGSGFFVGDGEIATASHVVLNAGEIYAITGTNHRYRAKVEKMNDTSDLAVLKLQDFHESGEKVLEFETSSIYFKDEKIFAFGYPLGGGEGYESPGTIDSTLAPYELVDKDAAARLFQELGPAEKNDLVAALSRNVIKGTIHLEPGDSGGPLVDVAGKVIGVADFSDDATKTSAFFTPAGELQTLLQEKQDKFEFTGRGSGSVRVSRIDGDKRPPFDWRSVPFI